MSKRIRETPAHTDHRVEGVHPLRVYINELRGAEMEHGRILHTMFEQIDEVFKKIQDVGSKEPMRDKQTDQKHI